MNRSSFIGRMATAALAATLVAAGASIARAAEPEDFLGTAPVYSVRNAYLFLSYGRTGTGTPVLPVYALPDTVFQGRWAIATVAGDPLDGGTDDNLPAFAWNAMHYQVEPQLEDQATRWYRVGNTGDGSYTAGPVSDQNSGTISSTWDTSGTIDAIIGGTTIQQQPVGVEVKERLSLVRDMVRAEYTFTNNGNYVRRVRARLFVDPIERWPDGTADSTLREGSWVVNGRHVERESSFLGASLTGDWRVYLPLLTKPNMVLRGIFNRFDATRPDRFVLASTGTRGPLNNTNWNYTIKPDFVLDGQPAGVATDDAAYYYYDTFVLLPGQSRTITSYVGLGVAESDPTPPYAVAVQAEKPTLGFAMGDDPDTQAIEVSYATPATFYIYAYLYNVSAVDISSASAYLHLPAGLSLADGDPEVKQMGIIPKYGEGQVRWKVKLNPGASGRLTYSVTTSATPLVSKTVTGSVDVPAQMSYPLASGRHLISIPFQFTNPDTREVLNLASDRLRLALWDPSKRGYGIYPDSLLSMLSPGVGYWFRTDSSVNLEIRKECGPLPVSRSTLTDFVIPIKSGWNMIGCPYVYSVPWANVKVSDGTNVYTLTEAVNNGWLRSTLYYWDSAKNSYDFMDMDDATMEPWRGYWLRADRDAFLIVPPINTPYASVIASNQRSTKPGEWRIQLAARTRGAADDCNYAGASSGADDAYDTNDLAEPPAPGEQYVSLRFVNGGWGRSSGLYTQDMRAADFSGQKVWDFEVETDQVGEDVTLTWPALNANLPRGYSAVLEDASTGRRVQMRTQSAYVFKAAQDTPRRFRLVVSRRAKGSLAITGVEVAPSGGRSRARSIGFQVSEDAVVNVRVLSPSGQTIKEVATSVPVSVGRNQVTWDGTTRSGATLRTGLVLMEITATSPEGNSVRVVQPHLIAR